MAEKKEKSLLECRSLNQVADLARDHFERKNFCVLTDGYTVWLSEQKVGEMPTQKIQIPKTVFDQLIRKYIAPQKRGKANG